MPEIRRAVERFMACRRNRRAMKQIYAAYSDGLDEDERLVLEKMLRIQKRLVRGEWR